MDCTEAQAHADRYLDAELEPAARAELESHVQGCPACAPVYAERQALQALLKEQAPAFRASAGLRAAVEARLAEAGHAAQAVRLPPPGWWGLGASVAAAAAIAVSVTWSVAQHQREEDWEYMLKDDAVAIHLRSLQERHLVDVGATEPGALRAWFRPRLPYAAVVPDLTAHGYTLVGGRLDYLYETPLAAVVYRRDEQIINLLTWPMEDEDRYPSATMVEGGLQIRFLRRGGANFCVISNMAAADFDRLIGTLATADLS